MLSALAEAWQVAGPILPLAILVKALATAATLLAAGSVLCLAALRPLTPPDIADLRRTALVAAAVAAVASLSRLPIRAAFLMGGTLDGATDPAILGMVADSPLGASIRLRLAGLALIATVAVGARRGLPVALIGAVLAALSFAVRGHALSDPRLLLGGLVALHVLCLGYWVGGFRPLSRAARDGPPERAGRLAAAFGRHALIAVGLLVVTGATLALVLTGGRVWVITPWLAMLLSKLAIFAAILGLAAWNRIALTPALTAGAPAAARRLRLSIRLEGLLILAVLAVTATLTTTASP